MKQHYERHGATGTPLHNKWKGIKQRCYNPTGTGYSDYGAKGIKMYAPWIHSFIAFRNYVMTLPGATKDMGIDRIENDKGYVPGNLRPADAHVQSANRRKPVNNTSGYTGVTFHNIANKYASTITIHRRKHHLGLFETAEEAVMRRNEYIIENNLIQYNIQELNER